MSTVLEIPGAFNYREFGGLTTADNKSIKNRRLIRGGFLSQVTEAGLLQLRDYGVRLVIDLRSPGEVEKFPDRLLPMMKYLHIPVFDDDPTDSTMSDEEYTRQFAKDKQFGYERMLRSYRKMVMDQHAIAAYRDFFKAILLCANEGTILFHCSAGKDRTGFCSYLLLYVLGVSDNTNLAFYLDSNEASKKRIQWRIGEAKKTQLGAKFVQSVKDLVVVKPDYLEQALSLINYEYGGLSAYLREQIGLSAQDQKELRKKLVN